MREGEGMVVDHSIFTIQGEILVVVRKSAESRIVLQKQSLFCSLSLTYHTDLTLAINGHTVFSAGGRPK